MIIKTTGIALRLDPFSRTSQIITWLTPDHGRVATLAKGAKRPKHNLVGQYDCFYTCEILFYHSRQGSLHILKECTPLNTRIGFRANWRASIGASYVCDLLSRLTPPGAEHAALHAWAEALLDFLETQGVTKSVLNWAELKLLKLLGMAPKLGACLACRNRLPSDEGPAFFSIERGGLVCTPCCRTAPEALAAPLAQDVLAMLRGWENTETPILAKRTHSTPIQSESAGKIIGAFMHYHLLETSRARDIATALI